MKSLVGDAPYQWLLFFGSLAVPIIVVWLYSPSKLKLADYGWRFFKIREGSGRREHQEHRLHIHRSLDSIAALPAIFSVFLIIRLAAESIRFGEETSNPVGVFLAAMGIVVVMLVLAIGVMYIFGFCSGYCDAWLAENKAGRICLADVLRLKPSVRLSLMTLTQIVFFVLYWTGYCHIYVLRLA